MEGAPKSGREALNFERGSDGWWQLREEAPSQAEALIGAIHGFEHMDAVEQLEELRALLGRLVHDNDNRYIAEEIAKRMAVMDAANAYQKTADSIPQVPVGRVLTEA